jgi:sugar lactone lactonase YvrE/DNA-directed RNA polymerase subunit RPC12/RpoP
MLQIIKCPSCSAPLEFDGDRVETCDFCGSKVIMSPNEMRNETSFGFGELLGQAQKLKEVLRLARSGNKIAAIKIYRETFGVGLAEAKDAVERLEQGESVNFHNVNFQSYTQHIKTDAVLNPAKVVGGSFVGTIIVSILLIFGVTLAVIWLVTGALDKQQPKNAPFAPNAAPSVSKTGEQSQFAAEALKFGGEGVGAGMFKDNRVIAVDPNGKIYSADYTGGKIQVFDANGKFLTQWTTDPKTTLHAMAADRKGNLYLQQSSDIHMFEAETGKFLQKTERISAKGMALTLDGRLVVASREGFVILDGNLKPVQEFKDAGERANAAFGFEQVAVDGNGVIYALDDQNGDVCKFAADGKFLNRFKSNSTSPNSIAIDPKGRVFVSDTSRIHVFDTDGKPLDSFKATQAFGMTFNDKGELFVASRPFVVKYEIKN